jgi:hypothetical protein
MPRAVGCRSTLTLVLLGCALVAAAQGQARAATPHAGAPRWQVVDSLQDTADSTYNLFAVTAPGPPDAWAFGRGSYGLPPEQLAPVVLPR